MKNTFVAVLMLIMMLCGCSTNKNYEPVETLEGNWYQTNSNSDTNIHGAVIESDTIRVYWIDTELDTQSLYWAGTYVSPASAVSEYSWESVNDKELTDFALLASGDDTKTFTYKDGELSYMTSALGVTQTMRLKWNSPVSSTSDQSDFSKVYDTLEEAQQAADEYKATLDNNDVTIGEENALAAAQSYLDIMPFSRDGLIEQLEFEQYTHSEALYAVENCGADWREQAVWCARNYLDIMDFSKAELIEQLEYEGFTRSQAQYGARENGY